MNVPITFVENVIKFNDPHTEHDTQGRIFRRDLKPGSAVWYKDSKGKIEALDMTCPCGCATAHHIAVCTGEKKENHWLWDGNTESPTLTPSLQMTTPCRWHGYLKNGIFERC